MEKKGRGSRKSDRPAAAVAAELKEKRDAFLQSFFKRGAELSDELMQENRRLRDQLGALEAENAELKTQLASDRAIRDLLKKIDQLERVTQVENDLESFANLYVASFQLHLSLRLRTVIRHIKELLQQLIGARAMAIYLADEGGQRLVPVASDGIELASVAGVTLHDGAVSDPVAAVVERTFLTGVAHIAEGAVTSEPAACIPLHVEDRPIGAIVVYGLFAQKAAFVTLDRELFKLLGAHAGATLLAAYMYTAGDGRLPEPEALRSLLE